MLITSWAPDSFEHVRAAVDALQGRVEALQRLLALGPGMADPLAVHEAGRAVEDTLEAFWAPVAWNEPVEA